MINSDVRRPMVSARESRPWGLWDSPITPRSLSQGLRLSDAAWDSNDRTLVWLEGRSDRGVLVCARDDDPAPRDLTADLSVRAMVGYGGGDFTAGHGHVWFVSGGRIYRQRLAGGPPAPITPSFGNAASPEVSPDGRWVLYVHSAEGQDCLALAPADGAHWPVQAARGRDFFMQPRWRPDGRAIAWIAWDHPNMPWDGTELWTADVDCTGSLPAVSGARRLAGGAGVAVFQPEYAPDGRSIFYVSDETGWGQIYALPLDGGPARRLTPGDGEYGRPAWAQGMRTYALVENGRSLVAVRSEGGVHRIQVVDCAGGGVRDLGGDAGGYTTVDTLRAAGDRVAAIVSASARPARVMSFDLATGAGRVWARATGETVPEAALSTPQSVSWPTAGGDQSHGLFYPPASERFESPGRPPLVVLIHGGPTSQVTASFQPQTQFFTTRGYAVLQVNYRGSTGYGRDYMLRLRGAWGIHDVADARAGAAWLAEQGWVDERKRVIMGGSAGGYTVLQSLVEHPGFYTAGICMYGVSNMFTLAADTHKFEARYLDSMLGPLPETADVYRQRSPIFHADRIRDPIAVFQGDSDQVVPRAQSDEIVASLRRRGVPHEYHVYEGEGHGWRRSDTIEQFYGAVDRFLRQYVVFA